MSSFFGPQAASAFSGTSMNPLTLALLSHMQNAGGGAPAAPLAAPPGGPTIPMGPGGPAGGPMNPGMPAAPQPPQSNLLQSVMQMDPNKLKQLMAMGGGGKGPTAYEAATGTS